MRGTGNPLCFFTSDFVKAFMQVPGVTELLHLAVGVQWDPDHEQPALMIPFTQVFGGRLTPLNLARFPAWCCYAMAGLGALPTEHCVNDIIGSERAAPSKVGGHFGGALQGIAGGGLRMRSRFTPLPWG